MSLHALVEKWREQANIAAANGLHEQARGMRRCADELEAALAGCGEAVAWEVQGHDGEWGWMHPADLDYYRNKGVPVRPLFTHPADAVPCVWTHDEDSFSWDSSCGSKYSFIDGGPEDNGHKFCHSCGKPLALNPGGSRE